MLEPQQQTTPALRTLVQLHMLRSARMQVTQSGTQAWRVNQGRVNQGRVGGVCEGRTLV